MAAYIFIYDNPVSIKGNEIKISRGQKQFNFPGRWVLMIKIVTIQTNLKNRLWSFTGEHQFCNGRIQKCYRHFHSCWSIACNEGSEVCIREIDVRQTRWIDSDWKCNTFGWWSWQKKCWFTQWDWNGGRKTFSCKHNRFLHTTKIFYLNRDCVSLWRRGRVQQTQTNWSGCHCILLPDGLQHINPSRTLAKQILLWCLCALHDNTLHNIGCPGWIFFQ